MADLTTQVLGSAGTAPSFVAAAGGGDTAQCDGFTTLIVKNGGGSPINVTFDPPGTTSYGENLPNKVYAVTNGSESWIRMSREFAESNGRANITYSDVTSVTVAVIK